MNITRSFAGTQRVTPRLRIESSGVDWFTVSAAWEAEGRQLSDADLAKHLDRARPARRLSRSTGRGRDSDRAAFECEQSADCDEILDQLWCLIAAMC